MYENWQAVRENANWQNRNVPPVLAVIVNSVKNANRIYDYIAGWHQDDARYPGKLGNELSNIDVNANEFHEYPRTILVHSRLEDPDASESGDTKRYLEQQAATFRHLYPDAPNAANVPFRDAPDRDVLRTVLNTVGKRDEPGERVRCVVSVGMLTEGWDAKTVTHVVGFRRFGTQLICEQVSGRVLRRVAHDADEQGYLYPEYADILGIPFDNLGPGRRSSDRDPPEPPPHYDVFALDERHEPAIQWPNVLDYHRKQARNPLTLRPPQDWVQVPPYTVQDHDRAERILTTPEAPAGEDNPLYEHPVTKQEFFYLTAKNAVDVLTEIDHENATLNRGRLFQQALDIIGNASRFGRIDGPEADNRWPNRHTLEPRNAASWLLDVASTSSQSDQDTSPIVPIAGEPLWLDTKRFVPYQSNRIYKHATTKSQINNAVCDSSWEVQLAQLLDQHTGITHWIRNERLGWTIPYRYDGLPRQYEPDFIAVAPLTNGDELTIVIEVKGLVRPTDPEKRRWTETYWLPAVNNDPTFSERGPWAYLYIDDEPSLAHVADALSETIASHLQ